jgi:hypothetical protein
LLGFWQKRGAERGFSMVNLWWIAGESWYVDGHFSGSKKMPLFLNLFLRDSHLRRYLPNGDASGSRLLQKRAISKIASL